MSRLDGYAQPSDVRLNGTVVWGRGGVSGGTVVNYVNGFTDNRLGRSPTSVGAYTTVTGFVGFDLGRLSSAPALKDSEVQLVLANIFDRVRLASSMRCWVSIPTTIPLTLARSG